MASSGIESLSHASLNSATSMLFEMRDIAIFGANDMLLDSSIEGTKYSRSTAALHTDGVI